MPRLVMKPPMARLDFIRRRRSYDLTGSSRNLLQSHAASFLHLPAIDASSHVKTCSDPASFSIVIGYLYEIDTPLSTAETLKSPQYQLAVLQISDASTCDITE